MCGLLSSCYRKIIAVKCYDAKLTCLPDTEGSANSIFG